MMTRIQFLINLLLSLLFFINFISLLPIYVSGDSSTSTDVIELTTTNFDDLTSSDSWFIEFYAPWCGHCKTLAPTYAEAARRLRGTIQFGAIDATVQTSLAQRYEIKGFPTIKFLREGEVRTYQGARTVDALVAYAKEMKQPPVHKLTNRDEIEKLIQGNQVSILFFGGSTINGVERKVFDTIAYRLQGTVRFYAVEKPTNEMYQLAGITSDETPIVVALTRGTEKDDTSNRFVGPWVDTQLREFVMNHRLPLISELDQTNFDEITGSGKKIVYAIVNSNDRVGTEAFTQSLYPIAREPNLRNQYVFATIDGIKYHKYVSQFHVYVGENGLDAHTQLPTVVVIDTDLDYFYEPPSRQVNGNPTVHPIGDASRIQSFLTEIVNGGVPLTCTTPWYNPTRYIKYIEKWTSKLPVWQVGLLAVVVMVSVLISMFFCCFYGMDDSDEETIRQTELKATREAIDQAKKDKSSSSSSSTDNNKQDEGLRSRKGK